MKRNWHIAWMTMGLVMALGSVHAQPAEGVNPAHPHPQKISTPQPPYLGGPGDGYASATTKTLITDPTETTPGIHLFPSPVRKGETAHIAVPNLQTKLEVLVQDATGTVHWRNTLWDTQDLAFMDIPTEGLAAGTYLVEIRRDGHAVTRKLMVQQK